MGKEDLMKAYFAECALSASAQNLRNLDSLCGNWIVIICTTCAMKPYGDRCAGSLSSILTHLGFKAAQWLVLDRHYPRTDKKAVPRKVIWGVSFISYRRASSLPASIFSKTSNGRKAGQRCRRWSCRLFMRRRSSGLSPNRLEDGYIRRIL